MASSSSSPSQQPHPKLEDPIDEVAKGLALLPVRPCKGRRGTKVMLDANYFALKMPKDLVVHRYSIEIVPPPKESSKKTSKPTVTKTMFTGAIKTSVSGFPLQSKAPRKAAAAKDAAVPLGQSAQDDSSAWPAPTGKKAEQVIKLLLDLPCLRPYRSTIFTDFRAILFSSQKLPEQVRSLKVQYRAKNNAEARPNPLTYTVRLIENVRGSINLSTLGAKYQGGDLTLFQYDRQELIQALNILFLHHARSSPDFLAIGGRRSFPSQNCVPKGAWWDIGRGLWALRGSFSSVRVVDSNLLVNVNPCHGAFYNRGRLEAFIEDFSRGSQSRAELETFLRGLRVGLTHYKDSNGRMIRPDQRVKTIVRLARTSDGMLESDSPPDDYHRPNVVRDFAGPRDVSFWYQEGSGNGRLITVSDYFNRKYGLALNPDQPVINVGSAKKPVYVGVEVCEVIYGQLYKRKLDGFQTTAMTKKAAAKNFQTREFIIKEGFRNVGLSKSNQHLRLFQIQAKEELTRVTGRRLESPTLLYHQLQTVLPEDGAWNMRDKRYREGKGLPNWSFLKLDVAGSSSPNHFSQVQSAIDRFRKVADKNGLKSPTDPVGAYTISIRGPKDQELKEYLDSCVENYKIKLLVVVLPRKDTRLYQAIKRLGDVEVGLHTVCVVSKTFCEGSESYHGNVALKINLKLGGINHELQKDTHGIIEEDKTMIVGVDVTHPSSGSSSNCPSVAAMVASVDNKLGQWPAVLSLQCATQSTADGKTPQNQLAPGQEIVSGIGSMLDTRLRLWYMNHKVGEVAERLPENILVYRDGVSEGQYKAVIEEEIKAIKTCCEERYNKQKQKLPRLTFIVVAKRHHTRFFPCKNVQPSQMDKLGNPKNGTVVDNGVTDERMWDFFLQSHTPLQGTARPAHYVVLKNEIFTQKEVEAYPNQYSNVADIIESVTYNLCWLYGRTTRSVSYCPPAYYADRVCERARCYLSGYFDRSPSDRESLREAQQGDLELHSTLKDTMFYI